MIPIAAQFLSAIQASPAANEFYAALTNGTLLNDVFHYLLVDLETGQFFMAGSQSQQQSALVGNTAKLAEHAPPGQETSSSITPASYKSPLDFFQHCFENYTTALALHQETHNEIQL